MEAFLAARIEASAERCLPSQLAITPAWLPPQELRPAQWRRSLAPAEVWERFDDAIESLSRARTGVSVAAIAQAFGQLSSAAWELAEAVERG
jgi:hypothetical protein